MLTLKKTMMFWESKLKATECMELWQCLQLKLHFWKLGEKTCPRMRFCIFRAVKILNRYNLSVWMKRVRNSGSKTHVKKQKLTSRTEIRRQSLKYLFLETPCNFGHITINHPLGYTLGANIVKWPYEFAYTHGDLFYFSSFSVWKMMQHFWPQKIHRFPRNW